MIDSIVQQRTKRCSKCKELKPLSQFGARKERRNGLGLRSRCKTCEGGQSAEYQHTPEARATAAAQQRQRRRLDPEKERARKQKYHKSEHYIANRDVRNATKKAWRRTAQGKESLIRGQLKRKYGITPEEYSQMLTAQGGVCAICRQANQGQRRLAVDHDHQTGLVRGLLCTPCNTTIGKWRDSPDIARRALEYILKFRQLRLVV